MNSHLENVKCDGLLEKFRQVVILLLLITPVSVTATQTMADSVSIDLDKVIMGNMVTITPVVSDLSEGDYLYRMGLVKKGRSGNSTSKQSGSFSVSSDGSARLSTTSINLGPADSCELTVTLIQGDRQILEKRFQCVPQDN